MSTLARSDLLPSESGDRSAIIIPGDPGLTISYSEFADQCCAIQQQLSSLGLGSGSAVSLSLPNSYEFAVIFIAVTWQRCIAAPLNPAYKEDEVDFYVGDIDAAAIIVPKNAYEQNAPAVRAAKKRDAAVIECWTDEKGKVVFDVKERCRLEGVGEKPLEQAEEDDVALVLHTSGTTGKPKAVPLSHRNLTASMENIIQTYQLTATDRTMLIMPLFHVHGLVASFLSTLKAGSAVIIPPRLTPTFWKDFTTHSGTWYTATPTMHKIILSFQTPDPLPSIRFIRSCSSPLSPQTLGKLETTFKAPVLEAYAMTEASHQITTNPLPPAPHYPGSVGVPGPSIEIRILSTSSDSEDPVADGEEGECCIRSSSVTAGYLSNPSANASSFTPQHRFFRTGDYGKFVVEEGGRYLYLTGRIKEFINKGGEKIGPVEIDNVIAQHPSVQEVVTFAIEDEMYGQDVGCAVVLKDGEELKARELQKWARDRMAPLKVPKKIWFPKEIPKTATGKVQRKAVAEAMLKS